MKKRHLEKLFDDLVPRRRRFLRASVVIPKASATSLVLLKTDP